MSKHLSEYVAWLVCLHEIMGKVRSRGLLAIECEVSMPNTEGSPFLRHAALARQPYLDFARDLLRLRLSGVDDIGLMDVYAREAIATLSARNWLGRRHADASLLKTIWLTLRAFYEGWSPSVACDFGRQAIPVRFRPDFDAMESLLVQARRDVQNSGESGIAGPRDLELEADRFIDSLGRP